MRRISIWCWIYLGLAAFSVAGMAYTEHAAINPEFIADFTAAVTLLIGVVAVFEPIFASVGRARGWLCFSAVLLIGAAAELIGIYTGFPFGRYEYTHAWWPAIDLPGGLTYPLLVPFAWTLVVGGAYFWWRAAPTAILIGALTATLVDLSTEHVLVNRLGYWRWLEPAQLAGAPYSNYIAWFVVSALALGTLWRLGARPTKRPEPAIVLCAHVTMLLLITKMKAW